MKVNDAKGGTGMKERMRRFTAVALACSLVFGLFFSNNTFAAENNGVGTKTEMRSEKTGNSETAAKGNLTESDMKNISDEAAYIREQMTQRKTVITGSFEISDMENMNSVFEALSDQIFLCTPESDEGDYLKQHSGGISWNYEASFDGNVTTFSYELRTSYYTTLEQEQEVADRIDEVLEDLSLDGLSDYEKAKKIYDYISINVSYDYEHLGDSSYMLSHTAYAALIQETAVCQGYASLFYRMAHEAGLSARIVTGLVDGEAHAWNMLKIGNLYYYIDATYASGSGNRDDYYLRGSISFADRQLDSDYLSADFTSEFPMSDFDYSDDSGNTEVSNGKLTSSIEWSVKSSINEEGEITYYLELQGNGEIPDYAQNDELPWEEWRDEITVVTVSSGITKIGSYVFADMDVLTTVQIANTVTALGDGAFYNCGKLTNLQIPDSVTSFGSFVIGGTYGKTQWAYNPVEKKLTVTGDGAMGEPYVEGSTTEKHSSRVPWNRYRDQIEKVVIEEGVVNLSTYALNGMTSLTVVTLPSTLEEIGEGSFESCTALTYICIPDSVKTIGHYAFRYCEGLRSIHIPASVTSIGVRAFADCPYLHEFYFYGDAPKFENQAIMDSEYITVYYDGSGWGDAKSLFEYLTFKTWEPGEYDDSGTNVSGEGIKSQTSGKYGEDIEWNYDEESAVLTLSGKGEMADPITIVTVAETTNITTTSYSTNAVPWNPFNQQIKAVNISDGITSISEYAFWWLTQIESITIPDSVLTVGRQSFVHCSKLQTVTFGENLTTIGEEAFKDCTALKEIYLSDKLTNIEESAFTGCETLTDVCYEGSESEWEDIAIGENNDPLINAEIHYNYREEEPWIPDGAFSISKSGTWVSGKECALYGTYSASTPGNAEAEANEIIWVSSDTSILDVSETIIDFNVADEENNHVSIQKTFTAKKAGTVTVTATAPDGRSASITVDVIDAEDTGDISTSVLDYEKYQAKYYSENVSLITGGYMTYSAIEDNYTPTDYALANILSFGWTAKFGFTDSSEIWETLLLDILLQQTANVSASGELENEILQLCNTLYDEALKNDISNLKDNIDANHDHVNTLVSKYESLKGISTSKSVIGKLTEAATTVEDFINYYAKYVELRSCIADDTEVFLNKMKNTTVYNDIPAFQRALDNVLQHLSVDENELAQLVIMETATDKLFTKAMNISIENIVSILIPGVSTVVDFTKDATICMMDAILDTSELSQLNVYLYMLDSIDDAAKEAMEKAASEYLNFDGNNYRAINGGLQFITNISSYGVSICRQWSSIVSTDILTKVSNEFLIASRPHYDAANDYFNLNHPSTINEKEQYVEELCLSDEKYIDSVLRSMPGQARIAWYKDSGASEDKLSCLVLFYVLNPETGSKTVSAAVVPQNSRVAFPELGVKSGYITPTQWYLDEECTKVADSNQLISGNTIFYTKWTRSVFYILTESGGATIVSMHAQNEQQTLFAKNTLSGSIKNNPENGIYEIPAYIDGYRVENLDDDIFAGVSNVSYVSLPGTLMGISDNAFASVEENATFVYVEGSVAEKYILEKKYSNAESVKELYFKNVPDQMIIGETMQLELVQQGSCISDDVQWRSSDENVVSVEDGKLIANAEGNSIISAQVGGVIASFEINITKEGAENPDEHIHSYATPEFIWSDDYQTCTAVFNCESCNNQQKVECNITSGTTNPTCTEDGKTVYTATVSFADKKYTDTQEEVITATGHTYEYVDNGDGTHTKVCTAGDDMVNEPHTYQNGTCAYCGAEEPKRQEATENKPSQSNRPLQGNTPAAVRISVIGTIFMDRASGARYQVTKAGIENKGAVTGAEVAYVEPATNARQIVIPEYVSFDGVRYKVTTVLENAFRSNKTVTKIKIGNNVISIGANAFSGCKKLKSVVIGKNVATIGNNAFKKCTAIKKVIIPAKVTFIGKNAFVGCKQLKNIIVKTKLLRKIGKNAFKGINKMAKIKVPKKQFKKYQKLFKKAKLAKNIRIAK